MLQGNENKWQNTVYIWAETRTTLGNPEFILGKVSWWGNPMRSISITNPGVGAVRVHGLSHAAQSFGWLCYHCLKGHHQTTSQYCGSCPPLAWNSIWLHNHPSVGTALLVVFHQWRWTVRWISIAQQANTSGQEITHPETQNPVKIPKDKSLLCSRARKRTAKLSKTAEITCDKPPGLCLHFLNCTSESAPTPIKKY